MEHRTTAELLDSPERHDHRRSPRIRKVRPVAFTMSDTASPQNQRTVSANVSRGGMLLVTRCDRFPPAGTAIDLHPFSEANSSGAHDMIIPGRIVYTRFAPRAELRFAGLKFETDLDDDAAALIGLDGPEDPVGDALKKLEELEDLAEAATALQEHDREVAVTPSPAPASLDEDLRRIEDELDAARDEFLAAVRAFTAAWGDAYLRDMIVQKHALARAKGLEGLRRVKDEWRSLQADLPALVDAQLNRGHLWPHRAAQHTPTSSAANPYYDLERDQPAGPLADELRKLLGFIGRIVIRHGFDDFGEDSDWAPLAHENALVTYRGKLVLSDDVRNALVSAAKRFDTYAALLPKRQAEREANARAEALRLWDEA